MNEMEKLEEKPEKRKRSSSSSSSSSEKEKRKRKKQYKKDKKKIKKKMKKLKKKLKRKEKEVIKETKEIETEDKTETEARSMAPMTKEEWEKRQSVVKRVLDQSTGRYRLIKGDGEVIEEIVSRDQHREINKQATKGDGDYFQSFFKK